MRELAAEASRQCDLERQLTDLVRADGTDRPFKDLDRQFDFGRRPADLGASSDALSRAMHELAAENSRQNDLGRQLADLARPNPMDRQITEIFREFDRGRQFADPDLPPPERSGPPTPNPRKITSAADIGALVRQARRRMKLSQQAFADLAGVGRRFVSELEAGKATLEFDRVLKVCAAAGVDVSARRRGA